MPPLVSIHAPTRGATCRSAETRTRHSFNSRAHEGRDLVRLAGAAPGGSFNSRAHEGRDPLPRQRRAGRDRFNSRAHEGRDLLTMYLMALAQVSIHAPTRGATRKTVKPVVRHGFNSRAHEGRDKQYDSDRAAWTVSIHAPTRGATPTDGATDTDGVFQFTRPRGARRSARRDLRLQGCFNSRAHEGRDLGCGYDRAVQLVSIHAPTRGATDKALGEPQQLVVSIHAPTRGATAVVADRPVD